MCDLQLRVTLVALKQLQEEREQTSDKRDEGVIMINRNIKLLVLELNTNTMLCTPDATKGFFLKYVEHFALS